MSSRFRNHELTQARPNDKIKRYVFIQFNEMMENDYVRTFQICEHQAQEREE